MVFGSRGVDVVDLKFVHPMKKRKLVAERMVSQRFWWRALSALLEQVCTRERTKQLGERQPDITCRQFWNLWAMAVPFFFRTSSVPS